LGARKRRRKKIQDGGRGKVVALRRLDLFGIHHQSRRRRRRRHSLVSVGALEGDFSRL
jgi:hypothetical protein